MVVSLLKIISTGVQDERLQPPKGQPDLKSFLTVIVKAGRYATNWTRIDFDTSPDFAKSSVIRLPTKGEMIGRIYLVTQMPDIKTPQLKAYYARKPIKLAQYYTSKNLYNGNGTYLDSITFTYPQNGVPLTYSAGDLGMASFSGVQLDDLVIDGIYTLSVSVPNNTNSVFSMALTDKALGLAQFNQLNTDTFSLIGTVMVDTTSPFLRYTYNATSKWQDISVPPGIVPGDPDTITRTNTIQFNGSEYIAAGNYNKANRSVIIENNLAVSIVQPSTLGNPDAKGIAFNGTNYLMVGQWVPIAATYRQISYSVDGLNWSLPISPPTGPFTSASMANSVVWNSSKWFVVGTWTTDASNTGIITTSTDITGATGWTPPFYPSVTPPIIIDLKSKSQVASTTLSQFITDYTVWKNNLSSASGSAIYSAIQTIVTTLNILSLEYNTYIKLPLSTPNITNLSPTTFLNIMTLLSNTIIANINTLTSLLTGLATTSTILISQYITVVNNIESMITVINSIAGLANFLGSPLSDISSMITGSGDYTIANMTGYIDQVESGIISYNNYLNDIKSNIFTFNTNATTLCNAINTALATGSQLTGPITSITSGAWYPVSLLYTAPTTASDAFGAYTIGVFTNQYNLNIAPTIPITEQLTELEFISTNIGTIITGIDTYNEIQNQIISGTAYSIAANSQGQILIGGNFTLENDNVGSLIYSADGGTTWIGTLNPSGLSNGTARAVAWSGSLWVAAGLWEYLTISISSDGINWQLAFNPINSYPTYTFDSENNQVFLPALSIGINPGVGIVIGGNWTSFIDDVTSSGSFSIAPATSLKFNWPTPNLIRPTQIFTDSVTATGLVVVVTNNTDPPLHILLGRWVSGGTQYGAISISTDAVTWSEAFLPHETTYTNTTLYDIAINPTLNSDEYITVVVGSIGNNGQQVGTMSVCSNQLQTKSAADWNLPVFPEDQTSGIGYNIVFEEGLTKYIVVGTWSNGETNSGFITASSDATGADYIVPYKKSGLSTQIGRFILYISTTYSTKTIFRYMVVGEFNTRSVILVDIYEDSGDLVIEATGDPIGPLGIGYGAESNGLIYVLVGNFTGGSISYSADATNWSNPFHPPGATSGYGTSVTWNGTQFIATGSWNTGTISYSRDGQNWESAVNPPDASTNQTNAVAVGSVFNGTRWVAAGNWLTSTLGANVALFTYGITFGEPVNPSEVTTIVNTPSSVIWNPNENKWIAAGTWSDNQGNTGYITRSPDGITWSTPSITPGVTSETVNQIYLASNNNTNIYMVGNISNIGYPLITSSDGLTWTPRQFLNNMAGEISSIVWSGSMWVAVSYGGFSITAWSQNKTGPIITSTDGINWSDPILPPMPNTASIQAFITSPDVVASGYTYSVKLNSVAWSGILWVAVGRALITSAGTAHTIAHIVTSPNGEIWTVRQTTDTVYSNDSVNGKSVAWNGSMWLGIGNFSNDNYIYVITSSNGINWNTQINIPFLLPESTIASAVAWNGYVWVAVGNWQSTDTNIYPIITSADGITWTPRTFIYNTTTYSTPFLSSITWNGSLWIATGLIIYNTTPLAIVATSTDSITWTLNPIINTDTFLITTASSRRILPYTKPQSFDPSLQVDSFPQANQTDFVLKWVRNANYGTGAEYFSRVSNTNKPTYTFTATNRTQWLTFGTYYKSAPVVTITLTKLSPTNPKFYTDLVGPHFGWTNSLGHSLIDSASITIGGNLVETINGQLMEILDEFQTPLEKVSEVSNLICRSESGFTQTTYGFSNTTSQKVITPLPFWFSRGDPGCVLPIDALNVDEVRLTVNFKPVTSLYYTDSRAGTPVINVEGGSLWSMLNSRFYYNDPDSNLVMTNMEPSRVYPNAPISAFAPDIVMPGTFRIPESYLLVEYIYLDKAEANRFRIADLQVPIVQHYILNPEDTNKNLYTKIPLNIPNPTRDIFFYCQRYEAPSLNAHFLATRDISINQTDPYSLWWPDATGLNARYPGTLKPGFSSSGSEPIRWLALNYNDTINRYSTENVALFRSFLPSIEQRKAPWVNRYYYNLPFGLNSGINPFSMPLGQANLDKIQRVNLSLGFHGITGDPTDNYAERFWVRTYAETYNIFRVYGGRGTMMFAY